MVVDLAGDAMALGPLLGSATGIVDQQQRHFGDEVPGLDGMQQRLKVGAGAGGHHGQP